MHMLLTENITVSRWESSASRCHVGGEVASVTVARVVIRPLVGNRAALMLPRLADVVSMIGAELFVVAGVRSFTMR
jgi:hypothetical protein